MSTELLGLPAEIHHRRSSVSVTTQKYGHIPN